MNREEFNESLSQLEQQLEEMNNRLEDAREQRNSLLRERFDLKEQRRYLRTSAGKHWRPIIRIVLIVWKHGWRNSRQARRDRQPH